MTEYKSPTGMVWLLGRIYCTGTPEDYKAVHALQDQMSAVPLSSYGQPFTPEPGKVDPAYDSKVAVREQVNALDGAAYFKLLAELLKTNPPSAEDAPMVAKLATLGIVPGQDFDAAKLDPAVAKGIGGAPKPAQDKIQAWFKDGIKAGDATFENGWLFTTKTGLYGTNYIQRALVTAFGLGANRPQDAVYPTSEVDAEGKAYDGENKYVIHFDKGQLPPVDGVLVDHDVQRRVLLRRQPAQSLQRELAQPLQAEQGRLDRRLRPERIARQGQGGELAARAEGQVRADAAPVLAAGETAIDPRRNVEGSSGQQGRLNESLNPERLLLSVQ